LNSVLVIAAVIVGIILFIRILCKPMKLFLKVLWNALLGYVLLAIINFFGASFGLVLDVTFLGSVIAGFFGIPGVIVLVILNII